MTENEGAGGAGEVRLELKYCERCGGLWLRPAGGGQIYCVECGKAMAELPEAPHKTRGARMPVGKRWKEPEYGSDGDGSGAGVDIDARGGVA